MANTSFACQLLRPFWSFCRFGIVSGCRFVLLHLSFIFRHSSMLFITVVVASARVDLVREWAGNGKHNPCFFLGTLGAGFERCPLRSQPTINSVTLVGSRAVNLA